MLRYGSTLWASLCAFLLNFFFWFTAKCIGRLNAADGKPQGNGAVFSLNHSQEDNQEVVPLSSRTLDPDFSEEKRSSEFSFSFLYQESKDSSGNFAETDDSAEAFLQSGYSASTRKYQFVSGKNVSGFVEKPEIMSFTVQEMFVDSTDAFNGNDQILDYVEEGNSEEKVVECGSGDPSICSGEEPNWDEESVRMEENVEVKQESVSAENEFTENKEINGLADYHLEDDDISYEVELLPRNEFSSPDLNSKSETSGDDFDPKNVQFQQEKSEVPSDGLPSEILSSGMLINTEERKLGMMERSPSINLYLNREAHVTEDKAEEEIDDGEYIELEPDAKNTFNIDEEGLSPKVESSHEQELEGSQKFGKASMEKDFWGSDSDDEDELDILLEHQQLVQQMKMEMKNARIKSLPTISEEKEEEECETPKMVEDLKPLRFEDKFEYKDLMEEIHKFHKRYAEKMRKLDILNYQSLNAINIVQLKDSQVFVSCKRTLVSSIKPFLLPSFSLGKQRRIFADPSLKSIGEIQRDLESVYSGQVCLSWEILRWQYEKLKLLLEYDSKGYHSYNIVAGEYQQLQVLMQRFLEDEPFQGPRIQHYVRSRSFCRSLLQVPMIRDDCFKDKKDRIVGEKDAIPITKLAETIKESMQVFWEFIRSEKIETNGASKFDQGSPVDHQDPADLEMLMNVKTCLEKKERKLRDIQKSTNCIVKKFQKHQASGQPSSAVFISQVELKLVSRVLNLSRLTNNQLLWCQKKLNNINIVNRKVNVEPVFLIFPC